MMYFTNIYWAPLRVRLWGVHWEIKDELTQACLLWSCLPGGGGEGGQPRKHIDSSLIPRGHLELRVLGREQSGQVYRGVGAEVDR